MSLAEPAPASNAPSARPVVTVNVIAGDDSVREVVFDGNIATRSSGNNDAWLLLTMLDPPALVKRLHITPGYFRQPRRWNPNDGDLIWNLITDPDQNPRTLEVCQKMLAGVRVPVVNPPALLHRTRRHEIPKVLAGIENVQAPKVLLLKYPSLERVRTLAAQSDFAFPAILRTTGSHNGEVLGVFNSVEDLAPIFGDRKTEYYLTEFVDVRGDDRLYRKTRFFFCGDQIITRQHVIADEWSVHGSSSRGVMQGNERLISEGRTMLVEGFESLPETVRQTVHAIRQRIGLDYCGLDCCLMPDGRVVVFECNATMSFKPHKGKNPATQHNQAAYPRMFKALDRLIRRKAGFAVD